MNLLAEATQAYLASHAPDVFSFWCDSDSSAAPDVLGACDALYCLKLIGRMDMVSADASRRFAALLNGHRLAGGIGKGDGAPLNVHRTAYALATLNLLAQAGAPTHGDVIQPTGWNLTEIFDGRGHTRWPWYLAHHAWRIGHWVGGIPSIVLSLWRFVPELAAANRTPQPASVLRDSDSLIDARTGLFRTWRSETVQRAFRALYRFRHDPAAGEVGGIAHLHWCNYAAGRMPYKAAPALFERAWHLLQHRPFMETVPYCLDFDVVQIARTAIPRGDARIGALRARLGEYAGALMEFYARGLTANYSLHKLPGGLATLHECALAAGNTQVVGLGGPPVDIAMEAHWI